MIRSIGRLPHPEPERLRDEVPLFAAGPDFARAHGGPITRAFLAALPPEWQAAPLVIDSHLVGLTPLADPGPGYFHREVYPDARGGAFDLANAERAVQHVLCAFGPSMPELRDENGPSIAARPGELIAYDGETWLRWPQADDYGLHFWLRATLGSARPLVDGRRNCT